jgi:hypothetical protein
MALETNARIPSPYVYQPVDFGSKIDAQAANKAAALKAGIQAKKDLKTKNDAALAVKPTWTTEGVLNGAIENKANQIRDTYSKMAAAGIPIWDATTPEGSAFAEEIAGLNKFSNEMKGYEQNINEIEAVKGADNDAYNYYVGKIGEAKDPAAVDAIVTDYRANKDLLAKAPDNRKIVDETVGRVPLDTEVADIKSAALNMKQIDLRKEIPSDKIQPIIDKIKTSNESQLEEKLFQFKKDKGISDPEFDQYTNYDDYLADKVRTAVALRANVGVQVKGSMVINVNNAGGTPTTATGNTVTITPGDANKQFQAIDLTSIKPEGDTLFIPISVDDSVVQTADAAASIKDEGGKRYIKLDDLWKFEDKDSPAAKQNIDWVWTDKAAKDKNWQPKDGQYKTPSGEVVNGRPTNLIWDQAGNGWATIQGSKGSVNVMIYPTKTDAYGTQTSASNAAKANAQQFILTFTDAGLLGKNATTDPFGTIFNVFDKQQGLTKNEL